MAATKPSRLFLSGDHPGKYQPSYLSNGDSINEEMYQPNAAASATYMKFLHLVDTQLSDDERSVSPPPPPPPSSAPTGETSQTAGDTFYEPLSPPTYDSVTGDADAPVYQDPVERERQEKEWQEELAKVEGEILTLRQVLTAKVRLAAELKRKMGITPLQEFKQDLQSGIQQLRETGTYQKTSAVMKSASEKTTSAMSVFGASVSKKFDEMRNSQTFKSVEERVETAYTNVKARVKGSKSNQSLDESFQASSAPTTPRSEDNPPLPEEKVPL